jgi:hypothetical protein
MQLKACKLVSSDDRRRKRAVQQDLDRSFAKEENLMAKFDQEKIEIERLQQLRQNLVKLLQLFMTQAANYQRCLG